MLCLPFESCKDLEEQGVYYSGWLHGHFITNLFVFAYDGRIIKAVIYVSGSVHDSTLADWGDVYEELEELYNSTGGKCAVDSAFGMHATPFLIKSGKDITRAKDAREVVLIRESTSVRQAAEWGMRAIQGSFSRLKDAIRFEVDGGTKRKIMLKLAVLLYNFCLEHVGLNQIRNTYCPEWSKDAPYFVTPI